MKKVFVIILIAALSLCGCATAEDDETAPELLEPVDVKLDTAEVVRQDLYSLAYCDASIVPHTEALSFTTDGVIDSFNVIIGDTVKQGDILATLDQSDEEEQSEELRDRIEYLQNELEFTKRSQRLSLESAQLELEHARTLVSGGSVTESEIKLKEADLDILKLKQKQELESAEFELSSLKRQLSSVEEKLGNNTIEAPYDGRIVYMKEVEKGTSMKAYETMFYIADDTRLNIDSAYISTSTLSGANEVYVHINGQDYPVTALDFDWHEYVTIALSGGELRTQFEFTDGTPENIESGMYAAIIVKTGLVEDALVVPPNALYSDSEGRYVYLVDGNTRVRQTITTGRSTTTLVEVTGGLEEGDLVYVKE